MELVCWIAVAEHPLLRIAAGTVVMLLHDALITPAFAGPFCVEIIMRRC